VDDRLEQRGHALAADDVAQLARELFLALLLGITHGIGCDLHPLIDLALEADLGPVVEASRSDEETDLPLLHLRETFPQGLDEPLAQFVRRRFGRVLRRKVLTLGLVKYEEAGAADAVRADDRLAKALADFLGQHFTDAAQELVEECPSEFGLDRRVSRERRLQGAEEGA